MKDLRRGHEERSSLSLKTWQDQLRRFAAERDWEQFHTPKNLTAALSVEASELLEIFQWMTAVESLSVMDTERAEDVRDEMADVLIYLMRLADVLDVDLENVVATKMERNAARFPVTGTAQGE